VPGFGELHGGHEAGEASSDDDDGSLRCHWFRMILRYWEGGVGGIRVRRAINELEGSTENRTV
jgi:hypothetical protein